MFAQTIDDYTEDQTGSQIFTDQITERGPSVCPPRSTCIDDHPQ